MAGHHMRTIPDVLDVKRIRMIANVDGIGPLHGLPEQLGKNEKLVRISKPFACRSPKLEAADHNGRAYQPNFVSSSFEALSEQIGEAACSFARSVRNFQQEESSFTGPIFMQLGRRIRL